MDIKRVLSSFNDHNVRFIIIGPTDIHPFVAGASFATLWKNRTPCIIEGVRTFVASSRI